jgi:hypothetical protein
MGPIKKILRFSAIFCFIHNYVYLRGRNGLCGYPFMD